MYTFFKAEKEEIMDRRNDRKAGDVTVEDGSEVVSKTIVGGRPRRRKSYAVNIPAGIEKILYLASTDRAFKARLLEDRSGAIEGRRISLTATESAVLGSVSNETLGNMIDQIRPRMHGKRRFMRAVAVAAVTLATGTAGVACEDEGPAPGDVVTETEETFDTVGDTSDTPPDPYEVQPDLPMDVTETFPDAGVEPDLPDVEEDDGGEEDAADVEEDAVED
jgi:hypothetical protein